MKVIVGIDDSGSYVQALRLLARLRLPHMRTSLVHVTKDGPGAGYESLVQHAELMAEQLDLHADVYTEEGDPVQVLSRLATLERADLIAIGSHEKGPFRSLLSGSVGRGLMLHWPGSLLVTKGFVRVSGAVRCVVGYDGDEICDQGLDRFIFWNPAGIEHMEVVTVQPPPDPDVEQTGLGTLETVAAPVDMEVFRAVAQRGAQRLRKAGFPVGSQAVLGKVVCELRTVMQDARGELLVLPSVPHGALERIIFGSTSLAEVVGEHHSILVVR